MTRGTTDRTIIAWRVMGTVFFIVQVLLSWLLASVPVLPSCRALLSRYLPIQKH